MAALFCAIGLSAVAGHYWHSYSVDRDVERLRSIIATLSQHDAAYADLRAVRSTHPEAWIFGTVDSPARLEVIRAEVAKSFGDDEAKRIVHLIRLVNEVNQP